VVVRADVRGNAKELPSDATMRLRPPRRWNRIGMRRTSEEVLPLLLPRDRERLQELREPCGGPAVEDPFDDVGREERKAQHAADVGAATVWSWARWHSHRERRCVCAAPRAIVAPSGAGAASETWNKPMVGAMQLG
jgi:hypothetical protein